MKRYHTEIGWSAPDQITLFGRSLPDDILGTVSFGDMAFLELAGRLPDAATSRMFNAMLVTLVEHGLTPSTLVARLTYLGAPEAMQAAVAAGLCGLGSVFVGSVEGSARMLIEAMPKADPDADLATLASGIVDGFEARRAIVPGIGHPFHKPIDPRTPRLIQIAQETGYHGPYVRLVQAVSAEAARRKGKDLPTNATGILGALACEMGFDWRVCRGLGVMARAVGLVGHILEESRKPMAQDLWLRTEREATEHFREAQASGAARDETSDA